MILCLLLTLLAFQHPHAAADRGAAVMGFDQDKTAHHFYLYADGGAIDIAVKDANDAKDLDAIRAHLPHIAAKFGNGDFDAPMLVHDTTAVPGIGVLSERRKELTYRYSDTP